LLQYLDYLNRNPDDSSKILREMEACYIAARPRLTPDGVRALLVVSIFLFKRKEIRLRIIYREGQNRRV